jgi:patatin-related protein
MSETNSDNSNNSENSNNVKEIRFAVVMYGGVSLAIYINGIAQELLKMSRSTTAGVDAKTLKSTDAIYRKVSLLLSNREKLNEFAERLRAAAGIKNANKKADEIKQIENDIEEFVNNPKNRAKTRFVVDVLTGTSAGGINAIFLAKALSNNLDIDKLKDMWLNEGDIGVLINDKKSFADIDLSAPEKARSLLNSNRMYLKLLQAFDDMGDDLEEITGRSNFIDELDLYVPTTDFRGTIVPLRLQDEVVEEKRFRQVFHFRYDENELLKDANGKIAIKNDFKRRNNAMLALAARATSSFPFAFEPMRLSQAISVIEEAFPDWRKRTDDLEIDSKEFFPNIVQKNGEVIEWKNRDLVDGGVLDNKPFSYAIDVLSKRRADFQVERKLLYIEPSPESFTGSKTKDVAPPDVLENAVASLSSIPGYETIREDLERLLERNNLIERVNLIIRNAEQDVFEQLTSGSDIGIYVNANVQKSGDFWEKQGLEDIARWKGRAVLPYYRLRIAGLTDEIARLVTQIIGIDENSEYFAAIRKIVKDWRTKKFSDYQKTLKPEQKGTVLSFLRHYDMTYRLRRLRFVQLKASRLYFHEEDLQKEMNERFTKLAKIRAEQKKYTKAAAEKTKNPFVEESIKIPMEYWKKLEETIDWKELGGNISEPKIYGKKVAAKTEDEFVERTPSEVLCLIHFQSKNDDTQQSEKDDTHLEQVRKMVSWFQRVLGEVFKDLQKKSKELSGTQKILSKKIKNVQLKKDDLQKLLDSTDKDSDDARQAALWDKFGEQISLAAAELESSFKNIFDDAREKVDALFDPDLTELPDGFKDTDEEKNKVNLILFNAVRGYLKHYYTNFDEYDQISFPIFYQTQVGEAVKVDVMRISPKDAKSLIDESKTGKQKLAGESLFHFGAFLDRVWRWNDIMWGRLDGAERLIAALLPDAKYKEMREFLTRQAQTKILTEEFLSSNEKTLRGVLADSLTKVSAGLKMREVIGNITQNISDDAVKTKLNDVLRTSLDENNVYDFIQQHYEVEKQLEPKPLLQAISRSTKVTGDIFEAIADDKADAGSQMRWIARLGQIFWGLVEVAAPNSFWNKLVKQWLMLLYLFEVVLIVGSTIFVKPEVQQFGIMSLILTLITHLTAITLHDYMKGGKFLYLLRFIAVGLMAILAISGAVFIYGFFIDAKFWEKIIKWQKPVAGYEDWQRLFPLSFVIVLFVATLVWRETKKLNVRFYGIVTLFYVLALIALVFWFRYLIDGAQGLRNLSPTLALEFPLEPADIGRIAGVVGSKVRDGLQWFLAADSFVFVPLYVGFLLFFSQLLRLRRSQWIIAKSAWFKKKKAEEKAAENKANVKTEIDVEDWKYVWKQRFLNLSFLNLTVIAVSLFIVFTGLADLTENYFSYAVLGSELPNIPQWKIDTIRYAATVKWFLSALATVILSMIFWRRGWWKIFTFAFLIAAGIGFAGLFNYELFKYFLMSQVVILPLVGILFIIFPERFARD